MCYTECLRNVTAGVTSGDVIPICEMTKFATIIVMNMPFLFIYPFLQKYFVKGVMIGAIKE